jgi:hypothetical protein
MHPVSGWTGRTACALQAALRLSNEAFAQHLGIGVRTVATWHKKPTLRPKSEMQQLLDTALDRAPAAAQDRFAVLAADPTGGPATARIYQPGHAAGSAEPAALTTPSTAPRLDTDPAIGAALHWLDRHAGWPSGRSRAEVAARLARLDPSEMRNRRGHRERTARHDIATTLAAYYPDRTGNHGRYAARYGTDTELTTSVLTSPDWLDLDCLLHNGGDHLTVSTVDTPAWQPLDDKAAGYAAQRLAETLARHVRLVDMPLYRLFGIQPRRGSLTGRFGLSHFIRYALTLDLLEGELLDALATGAPVEPGWLPLRDRYLPDVASVLDVAGRLCAGGALSLCAIARPGGRRRPAPDYLLLVQERSGEVVNAARRLAVIPKGFHQPLTDLAADVHIEATLCREMEEELFGREDLDSTVDDQRAADPMHPSRLSEPMRWLDEDPARLRMECTAFGLNLVSGNYEFACLIVIEDEEFWARYGGTVQANWEATGLRQYSSRNPELLGSLIQDEAWSNEGLFALLQGLRRLTETGGRRVNLPTIEPGVR